MDKVKDLTKGKISSVIGKLATPLIGASFLQMAYSMTDMIWLGKLGSAPVAAVGACFFFVWMGNAIAYTPKVGTEVCVSQSIGAGNKESASKYAANALSFSNLIGFIYILFLIAAAPLLLRIFHLEDSISQMGVEYLRLVTPGVFASCFILTSSAIYYGTGNSKTPFYFIAIGLGINIILDPLLIFGFGPIKAMGSNGAAIATSLTQIGVVTLFASRLYSKNSPVGRIFFFTAFERKRLSKIVKLGLPVSLQSAIFSCISMTLASFASSFGHIGVAAQSVGSQIEAVSWMTASGFSTALSSFVGQNYGAGLFKRIKHGYFITLGMAGSIGFTAGLIFILFPETIFKIFISEPDALEQGAIYLRILGCSQLAMVVEMVTTGAFNGVGKTKIPAFIGVFFTALRIPGAYILMNTSMMLAGIWWAVSISSIFKGLVNFGWFGFGVIRKFPSKEVKLKI
ncbi:MAG: MATE family efflux transporter [Bacteroidales bacterium]|nr:MATE family efflux transporter [Bacteroidales bacterium]